MSAPDAVAMRRALLTQIDVDDNHRPTTDGGRSLTEEERAIFASCTPDDLDAVGALLKWEIDRYLTTTLAVTLAANYSEVEVEAEAIIVNAQLEDPDRD
jgi:hypothetical protein